MRLFAALLPPAAVLDGPGQLADVVRELRTLADADRLRWTDRSNWHITLAFYGEVADEQLPELRERLARAARRRHPLELRIAGGGRFRDRALWAGVISAADGASGPGGAVRPVRQPVRELRRLHGAATAAGRRAGLETEEARHFRAHLTVARARGRHEPPGPSDVDLRPYVTALDRFRGEPWSAGELALVRSRLPDSGEPGEQPRYAQVAAWPLGG